MLPSPHSNTRPSPSSRGESRFQGEHTIATVLAQHKFLIQHQELTSPMKLHLLITTDWNLPYLLLTMVAPSPHTTQPNGCQKPFLVTYHYVPMIGPWLHPNHMLRIWLLWTHLNLRWSLTWTPWYLPSVPANMMLTTPLGKRPCAVLSKMISGMQWKPNYTHLKIKCTLGNWFLAHQTCMYYPQHGHSKSNIFPMAW